MWKVVAHHKATTLNKVAQHHLKVQKTDTMKGFWSPGFVNVQIKTPHKCGNKDGESTWMIMENKGKKIKLKLYYLYQRKKAKK